MELSTYLDLRSSLIDKGYAEEIDWQENLMPVSDAIVFRNEAIWVILNSGMKAQVASLIHTRIFQAKNDGRDISEAFGHKGKVAAIKRIMAEYPEMFAGYLNAEDKVEYLESIPFIGPITKWHLAKNLGHDCVKPDRHLVRIAKTCGMDCLELCAQLSRESGDKVSVIDMVLWRSANLGMI
jgi:hypothetical protein